MRIAVPVQDGRLFPHFGQSQKFAIVEADPETADVTACLELAPPQQVHSAIPPWLKEQGVEVVIAGGIGERAVARLADAGIRVVAGAVSDEPRSLVRSWIVQALTVNADGRCTCDHHSHAHGEAGSCG